MFSTPILCALLVLIDVLVMLLIVLHHLGHAAHPPPAPIHIDTHTHTHTRTAASSKFALGVRDDAVFVVVQQPS